MHSDLTAYHVEILRCGQWQHVGTFLTIADARALKSRMVIAGHECRIVEITTRHMLVS